MNNTPNLTIKSNTGETLSVLPPKKMSKTQAVLTHIKERGSIDAYKAINLYDVRYLPSTIRDLRDQGHNITKEYEINYISGDKYAVYKLEK